MGRSFWYRVKSFYSGRMRIFQSTEQAQMMKSPDLPLLPVLEWRVELDLTEHLGELGLLRALDIFRKRLVHRFLLRPHPSELHRLCEEGFVQFDVGRNVRRLAQEDVRAKWIYHRLWTATACCSFRQCSPEHVEGLRAGRHCHGCA
jgi:hypothetical protein